MKVPKYIREKMRRVAALNDEADQEMRKVEAWLEKHGVETSYTRGGGLRDGCGCSLEELEYGNDVTDELCEWIEKDFLNKGGE